MLFDVARRTAKLLWSAPARPIIRRAQKEAKVPCGRAEKARHEEKGMVGERVEINGVRGESKHRYAGRVATACWSENAFRNTQSHPPSADEDVPPLRRHWRPPSNVRHPRRRRAEAAGERALHHHRSATLGHAWLWRKHSHQDIASRSHRA